MDPNNHRNKPESPKSVVRVAKRMPWREATWRKGREEDSDLGATAATTPSTLTGYAEQDQQGDRAPMWKRASVKYNPAHAIQKKTKSSTAAPASGTSAEQSCSTTQARPLVALPPSGAPILQQLDVNLSADGLCDSFKTEYHPNSNQQTHIKTFEEYQEYDATVRTNAATAAAMVHPWRPFQSRTDFEFAELALSSCLNKSQIDTLIAIINKVKSGEDSFNITSHQCLCETWERAATHLTPFNESIVSGSFEKHEGTFPLYIQSIWDWAMDLIDDPLIVPHMQWDAARLYKHNGEKYLRFVHGPYTADAFWEFQSLLPPNGKPLGFIFYVDKTKLSSFGTKMGYPVYCRLANLSEELRNSRGYAGGRLVGWLPIVDELKDDSKKNSTSLANFKRVIWHNSFRKVLESIKEYGYTGYMKMCGDNIWRDLYPFVHVLSSDFEEQTIAAGTRGHGGLCPCPRCLVELMLQSDFAVKWPLRTAEGSITAIKIARAAKTKTRAEDILKPLGLRIIDNAFWDIRFADPHRILGYDHMHCGPDGLGGKHLWPAVQKCIMDLGLEFGQKVDTLASEFPTWRNMNHFDHIMHISFSDAKKLEDIVKICAFVTHNILTKSASPHGYLLVASVRKYTIVDSYLLREVQSEEFIEEGCNKLIEFSYTISNYIAAVEEDWNFPKMHMHSHAFDDIMEKGALQNYDSMFNEPMHGPLKDSYQLRTNFKNIDGQILKADHCLFVSSYIRNLIDYTDECKKKVAAEEEGGGSTLSKNAKFTFNNITLGAPEKVTTIQKLLENRIEQHRHSKFSNFAAKLSAFLASELIDLRHDLTAVHATTKIIEFRNLKVAYMSKVSWREKVDYLKISPAFNNKPRYDCALIDTVDGPIFARLELVFTIIVAGTTYAIALVQPFKHEKAKGTLLQKDKDMEFLRLRQHKANETEFIFARSIIRGAILVPTGDQKENYFAFDALDCDFAQRCRELLHPQSSLLQG